MRKLLISVLCLVVALIPIHKAYAGELDDELILTDFYTVDGECIYERVVMIEEDISSVIYCTEDGTEVEVFYEYNLQGKRVSSYKRVDSALPTYSVRMMTDRPYNSEYITSDISGTRITVPDCPFSLDDGLSFKYWRLDPILEGELIFLNPGDTLVIPNQDVMLVAILEYEDSNENPDEPIRPSTPNRPITPTKPKYTCSYTDISDHWAKDIIKYIDKLSLVDGETETTFAPDKPMTREAFVTAMARLADVESNYVDWAINIGLLKGYGNGEYGLDDTITREQMAVFFLRFLELTDIDYEDYKTIARYNFADDEQIADWAKEAVYEMQALDLIHGKGNDIFDPKGLTTRAEGATVIYNLCETVLNK